MRRRILLIIISVLILIQLYRPAKTNPAEDPARTIRANATVTPEVDQVFTNSCGDCHSYKTTWPWYSHVAPVSWFIVSDVNEGRRHFNLSDWAKYKPEQRQRKLDEACELVEEGEMPLKQYTWMHNGTKLSEEQRRTMCAWAKAEQARITATTGVAVPPKKQGGMHAEPKK
jgi:hypothetical protein